MARLGGNLSSEDALKEKVVLEWPAQSEKSVKEFEHPGLFAKCFPSVFPFGIGDPTTPTRACAVTLSDGIHHLQNYAYVMSESKLVWPFAQHRLAPSTRMTCICGNHYWAKAPYF